MLKCVSNFVPVVSQLNTIFSLNSSSIGEGMCHAGQEVDHRAGHQAEGMDSVYFAFLIDHNGTLDFH